MDALRRSVRALAGPLGYDRFVLYASSPPGDGIVERLLWLEGDWFGNGSKVDPETYLARCPVNRHVLETNHAFFWIKTGTAGEETYRVVRQPRGPGIHGLQVPIFGHVGLLGAMSFGGETIDSAIETRLALTLAATAAFHAAQRLVEPEARDAKPRLSDREREMMRWVASGRRQADIALLLGLSERTIENHLRRVRCTFWFVQVNWRRDRDVRPDRTCCQSVRFVPPQSTTPKTPSRSGSREHRAWHFSTAPRVCCGRSRHPTPNRLSAPLLLKVHVGVWMPEIRPHRLTPNGAGATAPRRLIHAPRRPETAMARSSHRFSLGTARTVPETPMTDERERGRRQHERVRSIFVEDAGGGAR